MKCALPDVLFVLGRRSWLRWIPEFLVDQNFTHSIEISEDVDPERIDQFVYNVLRDPHEVIVFLSDHSTALLDAEIERKISEFGVVNTVCQPLRVAEMAGDKRLMTHYAKKVRELETIPEFSFQEGLDYLSESKDRLIVAKLAGGTEGKGMKLFKSADELREGYSKLFPSYAYVLQPFVFGDEYSVTILCDGERYQVYEPVYKGPTSTDGVHPCDRERLVPGSYRDRTLRSKMIELAISYTRELRPRGLVEIELIVSEGRVYFLEINPSITTTMRMVAGISLKNLFTELPKIGLGMKLENGLVPTWGYAAEFPLKAPLGEQVEKELQLMGDVSVSSRITVYGRSIDNLQNRLREVQEFVNGVDLRV